MSKGDYVYHGKSDYALPDRKPSSASWILVDVEPYNVSRRTVDVTQALTLLSITGLNTVLPTWFGAEDWRASYTEFPVCTPTSLCLPSIVPPSFQPRASCQLFIFSFAISTTAYWICALSLLRKPPWAALYTPKIVFAVVCGLAAELLLRQDLAAIMLQVVPLYTSIGVAICMVVDLTTDQRRFRNL